MRPEAEKIHHFVSLMAVALVTAAEALCQQKQLNFQQKMANFAPERRIVVSIPDRRLALVEDGRVVKIYKTAVGALQSPTPAGTFTIVQRIPNPTWYGPAGKVVGPGKDNPIGTRWLGLSRKGYGIHGTNVPSSIGRRASHGCVRMRNRDVEDLFSRVAVGDVVELHGERDRETVRLFGGQEPRVLVAMAGGRE